MLVADYLVLYRRDVQRDRPDQHILRYIEQNWPLEATIQLHGLDYAWIYRAPAADWASRVIDRRNRNEQAGLIGYRLNQKDVSNGETLVLTLYRQHWPALTGRWLIQLEGPDGPWTAQPWPENSDNKSPQPGEIVEDVYHWSINQQMQAGSYQVRIGLQREANADVQWITPHVTPPLYVYLTQE